MITCWLIFWCIGRIPGEAPTWPHAGSGRWLEAQDQPFGSNLQCHLHPQSLTVRPWKMMVGRRFSYWEGHISGAMLNFGRVYPCNIWYPPPSSRNGKRIIWGFGTLHFYHRDLSRYGMFYVHPHKLPGSSRTQEARWVQGAAVWLSVMYLALCLKSMGNAIFS